MAKKSRPRKLAEQQPSQADLQTQIERLQAQVDLLAYLHTELAFQAGMAVATLVWLHDEKKVFLNEFIESENRIIARARAVKAAKAHQAQATMGLPQ